MNEEEPAYGSPDQQKRILIAGLFHESHTFMAGRTRQDDFLMRRGSELLSATGDASPLGGVLEVANERGWILVPALDMRAVAGPTVDDAVIELWWKEFESTLRRQGGSRVDALYLVLHGAMASESFPDVEGEILTRIRNIDELSDVVIGGVTDLHANFSERMARTSNTLLTYRENPHTDAKETAIRAARLLDDCLRQHLKPVTVWEHPPLMWPPTGTDTSDEPMASLEALARRIESEHPDILAVNVHAGYSFADTFDTGVSFTAITIGNTEDARSQLFSLSALALENKERGTVLETSIQDVFAEIEEMRAEDHGGGPILLVEPSENIGGGAPGDGVGVLQALIEHQMGNAAVVINDPAAVAEISEFRPGMNATLRIGGKSEPQADSLTLDVELVRITDGAFELEQTKSHWASFNGLSVDMGPCAVVRCQGIWILLTSRKTPPMDLGQLRSQGIVPESLDAIGLKSGVAHRMAYDPIARASFRVATHGPCASDLKLLPFRHVKRPIYPLDSTASDA